MVKKGRGIVFFWGGGGEIKNKAGKKGRQSEPNKAHYLPFLLPLPLTFLTNILPQILLSYFFEVSLLVYYFFTSLSSGTARPCYQKKFYYTYRGICTQHCAWLQMNYLMSWQIVLSIPRRPRLSSVRNKIFTLILDFALLQLGLTRKHGESMN